MKISIIGAGNIASQFCYKFSESSISIHQIYNRTLSKAESLAKEFNITICKSLIDLDLDIDLLIIAVRDDAISELAAKLNTLDKTGIDVVHTSGSKPSELLTPISNSYGVFYPLQTFKNFNKEDWSKVPMLLTTSNQHLQKKLEMVCKILTLDFCAKTDEQRKALHVSAVIINNFINHLLCLNSEWIEDHNSDMRLLIPLLNKTIENAKEANPCDIQTGPAIRQDNEVIEEHIKILAQYPELQNLYTIFSKSIQTKHA